MHRIACLALLACLSLVTACQAQPQEKEPTFFERLQGATAPHGDERDDARGERERAPDEGPDFLPYYERATASGPRAAVRVTWEALARERELYEQSSYRRPQGALAPDMKITLLSESHPEAERARRPRTDEERERYAQTAIVPDADLLALVRALEQQGFSRLARPTYDQQGQWSHPAARGRVTVEEGSQSLTLLSMRGQGQNPATQGIPALYSEAKRAVVLMRNRTATLNVTSVERGAPLVPFGR